MADDKVNSALRLNKQAGHCGHLKTITCSQCRLSSICLPIALSDQELVLLDDLIQRSKPQDKGHYLYRMDDQFDAIYAIRSGSFKSFTLLENGTEQITGFYLPGDVIGVDGLAQQRHSNNMVALERSSVCKIPFEQLEDLSTSIPTLQRNLFRIMGSEIIRDQQLITLLGGCSAEQKLASFLINLSTRHQERGQSDASFTLTMARGDIANYLGLTIETISRLFGQFKKKGILAVANKEIKLRDKVQLQQLLQKDH